LLQVGSGVAFLMQSVVAVGNGSGYVSGALNAQKSRLFVGLVSSLQNLLDLPQDLQFSVQQHSLIPVIVVRRPNKTGSGSRTLLKKTVDLDEDRVPVPVLLEPLRIQARVKTNQ
jgi:hypothetical protein